MLFCMVVMYNRKINLFTEESRPFNCPTHFFDDKNSLIKWRVPRRVEDPSFLCDSDEDKKEKESPLEKLLNGVFPKRQWEEGGITWCQKISLDPAKRPDIIMLSQRLDKMMNQFNGRSSGICDVRRRLHTELLDELTRQMIIEDEPLGLLLLKVRDNLGMSIMCYKALFENSIQYGLKKALEAEEGRRELEEVINKLQDEKGRLEEEKKNALKSVSEKEKKTIAEINVLETMHAEKVELYEKTNQGLKELLESVMLIEKM